MNSVPLNAQQEIVATARALDRGRNTTQSDIDALCAQWEGRLEPSAKEIAERFAVVDSAGRPLDTFAPRWLCHTFGLRHRAVEILFRTPAGLLMLQRRSRTKAEWPGALDMSVAGHVSECEDGRECGYLDAALREIAEEIGLNEPEKNGFLLEGALLPVGEPYFCFEGHWGRNPPFLDAEVRQIYTATLSGSALEHLHFADGEVEELLFLSRDSAWGVLLDGNIAGGLRYSLPRYLDWLENRT